MDSILGYVMGMPRTEGLYDLDMSGSIDSSLTII